MSAELSMHGVAAIEIERRIIPADKTCRAFETVRLHLRNRDGEVIATVLAYADQIGLPVSGDLV